MTPGAVKPVKPLAPVTPQGSVAGDRLLRGGTVAGANQPGATAVLLHGGRVAWTGTEEQAAALGVPAARTVDLAGALVTPGFVDSHAHVSELGLSLRTLDLGAARSAGDVLAAVVAWAATLPPGAAVLGQGWDESTWADPTLPSPEQLERAAGRWVYLARCDVHTALVSSSLLGAAGLGERAAGHLEERTHAVVRAMAMSAAPEPGQLHRAALNHLASSGHVGVVEMAAQQLSGDEDLRQLLSLAGGGAADPSLPSVWAFWGALVSSLQEARAVAGGWGPGLVGLGGDLSADGSLGARSARLREPYADAPFTRGEPSLSSEQVAAHVEACTLAGIPAAFHAIGDAAVDAVLAGFEAAASRVGVGAVAAAGHRVEHAEGLDSAGIAIMARLGLTASVQPRFDALWGGPGGLYEQRLGARRAATLNPFGDLAHAGVPLALGSDAPVTGPDPWAAVAACLDHHRPAQRLSAGQALAAHTSGGYAALGETDPLVGTLAPGAPAHLALWDGPGEAAAGSHAVERFARLAPEQRSCRATLRHGVLLHGSLQR